MGSSYAGWVFPKEPFSQYKQEEDRLTAFCLEDPRVSEYFKLRMPVLWQAWQNGDDKDALTPNQIHEILEYATNLWFGSQVVRFTNAMPINEMIQRIAFDNLPVVVSGVFPKSSGSKETINHIVVLVGFIVDIDFIKNPGNYFDKLIPDAFIFDDPWGNFIEGYEKGLSGNDIVCPYDLALKYLKPVNNASYKWGYRFNRGASIV
jgi:hypothetical protein